MDAGIDVQQVVRAPEGVRETLAFIGLGSPVTRAALITTVATMSCYATKMPRCAFTPEGKMKKFSMTPVETDYGESEVTNMHFVLVPMFAFALALVFF